MFKYPKAKNKNDRRGRAMLDLSQIGEKISHFFSKTAERMSRASKFVGRASDMTGPLFVKTLVFGWVDNPNATLENLAEMADDLGVEITAQGIDNRINDKAVNFLEKQFNESMNLFKNELKIDVKILQQFSSVELIDSTTVALPNSMLKHYLGCGGNGPDSSLKVQLTFDLLTNNIRYISLEDGRAADQGYSKDIEGLEANALRISDLGYFKMGRFATIVAKNAYFLSRFNYQTALYSLGGDRVDLLAWLKNQSEDLVEDWFLVGQGTKLKCRLVARRLPQKVADKRRAKAKKKAKNRGKKACPINLALLSWCIFITNVPESKLNASQVCDLYPVRWQIELIFKHRIRECGIDRVAGKRRERVLCEIYSKLIGLVIFNFLVGPHRINADIELSMIKTHRTFSRHALRLALSLSSIEQIVAVISKIIRCFFKFGCKNRRVKSPSTLDLLAREILASSKPPVNNQPVNKINPPMINEPANNQVPLTGTLKLNGNNDILFFLSSSFVNLSQEYSLAQ